MFTTDRGRGLFLASPHLRLHLPRLLFLQKKHDNNNRSMPLFYYRVVVLVVNENSFSGGGVGVDSPFSLLQRITLQSGD